MPPDHAPKGPFPLPSRSFDATIWHFAVVRTFWRRDRRGNRARHPALTALLLLVRPLVPPSGERPFRPTTTTTAADRRSFHVRYCRVRPA